MKNCSRIFLSIFFCNEKIYSIAKGKSYVFIDIALAKGSPEAIAESFYASMRCQQQPGGQTNEIWSDDQKRTDVYRHWSIVNQSFLKLKYTS